MSKPKSTEAVIATLTEPPPHPQHERACPYVAAACVMAQRAGVSHDALRSALELQLAAFTEATAREGVPYRDRAEYERKRRKARKQAN